MILRQTFSDAVALGVSSVGLPNEVPTIIDFPHSIFYNDQSDLSPVNENIDKVVYALTKWQPKVNKTGVTFPGDNLKFQGKDLFAALDAMNWKFLENYWGDGLPITPPTPERVAWIMTGTDLAPDYVLPGDGKVMNLGGITAVKSLAILLAMAGGRPEYLPVVLAATEAITTSSPATENWQLGDVTSTTRSTFPSVIVSGTIGKQIRLGSGYGLLGPDPRHPANASIGRALRFMLQILGGAVAGVGTMSNFGGMRFTNVVFAEDEEGMPKDWPTLGEDRGFKRGENAITSEPIGNFFIQNISSTGGKDSPEGSLLGMVPFMVCRETSEKKRLDANRSNGYVMFPDTFANLLRDAGWTKQKVKQFLYEQTLTTTGEKPLYSKGITVDWKFPYAYNAEQICLVIAGGAQAQHSYIMNSVTKQASRVSRKIQLPKNWDKLLEQAEKDLGPNPGHTD